MRYMKLTESEMTEAINTLYKLELVDTKEEHDKLHRVIKILAQAAIHRERWEDVEDR